MAGYYFREITDINILSNYIHLRYVDLSKNKLRELSPLNALTHCLTLKVQKHYILIAFASHKK